MRIAYFDCFSGASGDMILGALIDAGLSAARLRRELRKLGLPSIHLTAKRVVKGGISATQVVVEGKEKKSHRNLKEMLTIIDRSGLDPETKEKSREIFRRLATAEGKIHRVPAEEIHFHELGGLDSVVDITGAVWAVREMGLDAIYVSKVNLGTGFVRCEHGLLPVPSPAALSLMKGKPVYSSGTDKELLTPTGAALLSTLGTQFGTLPPMRVEQIGYGAGRSDLPHPNVLRVMIGTLEAGSGTDSVVVMETNIDDMNPQFFEYLIERLLGLGVLDVFLTPVLMKKSRPATVLTVICPREKLPLAAQCLLQESTTLGVRWREEERVCAEREVIRLETKHGAIHFKMARWAGEIVNLTPEYEDCKRVALKERIPLKRVFEEANKAAQIVLEKKKRR